MLIKRRDTKTVSLGFQYVSFVLCWTERKEEETVLIIALNET